MSSSSSCSTGCDAGSHKPVKGLKPVLADFSSTNTFPSSTYSKLDNLRAYVGEGNKLPSLFFVISL
jgi:hypothetical protein